MHGGRRSERSFILRAAALAALFFLSFALLYALLERTTRDRDSYMYVILDKHAALARTQGRKMVLVGGSNIAFGVDSGLLEERLGQPVLNGGLTVEMGIKFMLRDIEPALAPGDTVLLMPEYAAFFGDMPDGGRTLAYTLASIYPRGLARLDVGQFFHLLGFAPRIVRYMLRPRDGRAEEVYLRSGFDARGDMTAHLGREPHRTIELDRFSDRLDRKAVDVLEAFCARMEERGVACLFMYPLYHEASFDLNERSIRALQSALADRPRVKVLGTPEDFRFPDGLFFDTAHHPDARGRRERTLKMLELLGYAGPEN